MKFLLTCLLSLGFLSLSAQKILFETNQFQGVNANAKENNRWISQTLRIPEKVKSSELRETAGDFFTIQYGKPLEFTRDLIREFNLTPSASYTVKDGALQFHTGEKGWSLLFGPAPGDLKTPSLRIGAGWGRERSNLYRLEMEIEQNSDQTEWQISTSSGGWDAWNKKKNFTIQGKQKQKAVIEMGTLAWPPMITVLGMKFECKTPNANVKIHSMRMVPYSADAFWRKTVSLNFEPIKATLSWIHKTGNYDLYVNGKKIASGKSTSRTGIETFDLTNLLKSGKNVIAFRDQFLGGWNRNTDLTLEGVAIGRNGEIQRILGDSSWKWSYTAPQGWEQTNFQDHSWNAPQLTPAGVTTTANGTVISAGFDPAHMGLLDVKEIGTPYPIFDHDGEIAYQVKIPAGIQNPTVQLKIVDADSGKTEETLSVSNGRIKGDFREFTVRPKLRKTGAYRTFWTLMQKQKTLDSKRDELIIAGPIQQDFFAYKDFEKELEKRLQPVQKIDCSATPAPDTFLDHSGMHSTPAVNLGKVVEQNGMKYRETGKTMYDYFAYKLNIPKPGEPMIAEVVVPDDADRYIYAAVVETFPVPFENNGYPLGMRSWPNATGCASTGDFYPLSKGKKAFRFVFFPASRNSTLMIQNGRSGIPAAACEINIYAVKNGLPALKIPQTERIYANHNEQIVFNNWSAYADPVAQGLSQHANNYDGAWINAYRAISRKVQWLRFQGHNASVEGAYMYEHGLFSSRHSGNILNNDRFDYYFAILKLYKYNGIKQLIGFEYMRSACLDREGRYNVSDKQIQEGTARGIHTVDRHGKQVVGYIGMGLNHMSPVVWETITDLLKEMYTRYDGIGNTVGLFTINGGWWLPGFTTYSNVDAAQVGYDDDSIESFEKDTGIKLGLPWKGADRFPKRYELLTGKYAKEWFNWRGRKLRQKLEEMQKIVSSGKQKWKLFSVSSTRTLPQHPFNTSGIAPEIRNAFVPRLLEEAGFAQKFYGKDKGADITLVPMMNTAKRLENNHEINYYGMYTNKGSRELYRKNDAVYLTCDGLNENIGTAAGAAKRWWWRTNSVSVYDRKPIGDFAYADMVNIISDFAPTYLFHTWIDVNQPTAHGEQARRFLKAFYSIPKLEFKKFDEVSGIEAKTAGNYLLLINDTPYPLTGTLTNPGTFTELVYDTNADKTLSLSVRPFSVLVCRSAGNADAFRGKFRFEDKIEKEILLMGENILKESAILRKLPKENLRQLRDLYRKKDVYALKKAMDDFEVLSYAKRFFDSREQMLNQNRLMKELTEKGSVRINCGCSEDYTDPDGNLWLPDQSYTGFSAYGNEFANPVDRGNVSIRNTKAQRVYQTEAWGTHLFYHIPLPDGEYTVKLHFAETWNKEHGRVMQVTVNGKTRDINPLTLAGGPDAAGISVWTPVPVTGGLLSIELQKGPEINGIEIIKKQGTMANLPKSKLSKTAAPQKSIIDWKPAADVKISWSPIISGSIKITGNKIEVKTDKKAAYLIYRPDSNLYINAVDAQKATPKTTQRTISLLVRAKGENGLFQIDENVFRFDIVARNGKIHPAITAFPPGKLWFTIPLPPGESLEKDKWYHIAMTVDPDGDGSIFINGELRAKKSMTPLKDVKLPSGKPGVATAIWKTKHSKDFQVDLARISYKDELMSTPKIKAEADEWLSLVE